MNINKCLLLGFLLALLAFGCSKKQEDAAELEQEMLALQDTVGEAIDTTAGTSEPVADVAAVPEEPEPELPSAPAGGGYTVQVAGCEDRTYAEYLVQKYTNRGYEPYVSTAAVEGQTYYRVRVGAFETLAEAKALKAQIADRYSVNAWIDYSQ